MEEKRMSRKSKEGKVLQFFYNTALGRFLLKGLSNRYLSCLCGRLMDSRVSCIMIPFFVKKNHIHLSECKKQKFSCFNDFFTREIRPELRPICRKSEALIAPCDGLLSAYPITGNLVIRVKQSRYCVSSLLKDKAKAEMFRDGICLIFRLCVNHYHRYCYVDDGRKGENYFIPGKLHTVRPIAWKNIPVFTENCREYTIMDTEHFGKVAQIEVGAMLVGKIKNYHGISRIARGQEKGMFLYGGSTIVVLLQKDVAILPSYIYETTRRGEEIPVKMGEQIGEGIF